MTKVNQSNFAFQKEFNCLNASEMKMPTITCRDIWKRKKLKMCVMFANKSVNQLKRNTNAKTMAESPVALSATNKQIANESLFENKTEIQIYNFL